MALILKAKNTIFENYIATLQPSSNPSNWFDFGVNEAKSTANLAGGVSLTLVAPSGAVSYGSNYATLPQIDRLADFFSTGTGPRTQFSIAAYIRPGGQYERVYTIPSGTSNGMLVDSSGALNHVALLSDSSRVITSTPLKSRPAAIVGTLDGDSVAGEVAVSVSVAYSDGTIDTVTNTFAGTLHSIYDNTPIDLGKNDSGEMLLSEVITYDRVLTSDEIGKTLEYLRTKYS